MKVYLVYEHVRYEDTYIDSIWEDEEEARQHAQQLNTQKDDANTFYGYDVREIAFYPKKKEEV